MRVLHISNLATESFGYMVEVNKQFCNNNGQLINDLFNQLSNRETNDIPDHEFNDLNLFLCNNKAIPDAYLNWFHKYCFAVSSQSHGPRQ